MCSNYLLIQCSPFARTKLNPTTSNCDSLIGKWKKISQHPTIILLRRLKNYGPKMQELEVHLSWHLVWYDDRLVNKLERGVCLVMISIRILITCNRMRLINQLYWCLIFRVKIGWRCYREMSVKTWVVHGVSCSYRFRFLDVNNYSIWCEESLRNRSCMFQAASYHL